MQPKTLILGMLAALVCLWLLLTWEPVSPEEPAETSPQVEAEAAPSPPPPPTAAEPVAAPAVQEPAAPAEPAAEATPTEPTTPAGETPSNFKLERANPAQPDDIAQLPPPSESGPLAEMQARFEGAARDAESSQLEKVLESGFKLQHVPPELLESAVCHGATCRVRTRWTPARAGGFTLAVTSLAVKITSEEGGQPVFDRDVAVGQASERNSNGERTIDVYFRKREGSPTQGERR